MPVKAMPIKTKPAEPKSRVGISRRHLLLGTATSGLCASMGTFAKALESTTSEHLVIHNTINEKAVIQRKILASAATDKHGTHWLISTNLEGQTLAKVKLPARAHQVIQHPFKSELCVIARRPGQFMFILEPKTGVIAQELAPEPGFHFYGHAIFSNNGRYLISTENHISSGNGYIVVRDAEDGYRVLARHSSFGIGPHEIKLSQDQDTLVIANGGIKTHPDKGREKLNLDTMSPSLTYISLRTGALIEQRKLPSELHQLSIRHIDLNHQGEVIIAMQYQGDRTDIVPLIATHKRGEELQALRAPNSINQAMKHYCGSVCFDSSGNIAAVSSPKGNMITFWDIYNKRYLTSISCKDACGLASNHENEFVISNGRGELFQFNLKNQGLKKLRSAKNSSIAWDNHLLAS